MATMPIYRVEVKLKGDGDVTVEELWTDKTQLPNNMETATHFIEWFWNRKSAMETAHRYIEEYGIKALI